MDLQEFEFAGPFEYGQWDAIYRITHSSPISQAIGGHGFDSGKS